MPVFDPSNYTFSIYAVPVLLVGLLIAGLGIAALVRERASSVSLVFALLTFSVAVWLICFALIYSTPFESIARWWVNIEHLGVVFIPSTVLFFALVINK